MNQDTKSHGGTGVYWAIAAILTIITAVEVGVFYVPQLQAVLPPLLLVLSAAKFTLVVMFYMHLKGDHKIFKAVFVGPLIIAIGVLLALLFLLGQWSL